MEYDWPILKEPFLGSFIKGRNDQRRKQARNGTEESEGRKICK